MGKQIDDLVLLAIYNVKTAKVTFVEKVLA